MTDEKMIAILKEKEAYVAEKGELENKLFTIHRYADEAIRYSFDWGVEYDFGLGRKIIVGTNTVRFTMDYMIVVVNFDKLESVDIDDTILSVSYDGGHIMFKGG